MANPKNPNLNRVLVDGKYYEKEDYEKGIMIVRAIRPYGFTNVKQLKPTNYEAERYIKNFK